MAALHTSYLQQKTEEALRVAKADWAEASRLLCLWVETDHKLLLALTAQYLRGAAAQSVQQVARAVQHQPAKSAALPPSQKIMGNTAVASADKAMTESVWDAIITQMQDMPEMDAAEHTKALRTIAKAFVAKRFDAHDEGKGRR